MFTNKKAKYDGDNKVLIDAACLSGDTKPTTGVANGSKLLEMDTSTVYAFDEANGEWLAQSSSGGGGGGAEPLIVTGHYDSELEAVITDKTCGEITEAVLSGRVVIYKYVDDYLNEGRMQVYGYTYQDNTPDGGNISVSFTAGNSSTLSASGDTIEEINAKVMAAQ